MLLKPYNFITTLLFFIILSRCPPSGFSDDSPPACPYPCLPPPTMVTNYPPPQPYTPAEPNVGYPPPPGLPETGYYPPPSGYVPFYYPPPYYNLPAPPPPNPILPYFPFYYKSPPNASAPSVISRLGAALIGLLALSLGFLLC